MKKQTFNILLVKGSLDNTRLEQVEAEEWDNPYGVKIFIEKRANPSGKGFEYYASEYYTGMKITSEKTRKSLLFLLEKIFNDPDLTDLGRKEKIDTYNQLIKDNVSRYGYANN